MDLGKRMELVGRCGALGWRSSTAMTRWITQTNNDSCRTWDSPRQLEAIKLSHRNAGSQYSTSNRMFILRIRGKQNWGKEAVWQSANNFVVIALNRENNKARISAPKYNTTCSYSRTITYDPKRLMKDALHLLSFETVVIVSLIQLTWLASFVQSLF